MATDERKNNEKPIKDLSAKRPDAEKEEQVKGGGLRTPPALDE